MSKLKPSRELRAYLLFGGLTTALNFGVYLLLYSRFGFTATVANAAAWAVSVIFAFVVNKQFVYESRCWAMPGLLQEAALFAGSRIASGLAETGFLFLCCDVLGLHALGVKIFAASFVVAMNYITGRDYVFRHQGGE